LTGRTRNISRPLCGGRSARFFRLHELPLGDWDTYLTPRQRYHFDVNRHLKTYPVFAKTKRTCLNSTQKRTPQPLGPLDRFALASSANKWACETLLRLLGAVLGI
jgi:hypothetical protein